MGLVLNLRKHEYAEIIDRDGKVFGYVDAYKHNGGIRVHFDFPSDIKINRMKTKKVQYNSGPKKESEHERVEPIQVIGESSDWPQF